MKTVIDYFYRNPRTGESTKNWRKARKWYNEWQTVYRFTARYYGGRIIWEKNFAFEGCKRS